MFLHKVTMQHFSAVLSNSGISVLLIHLEKYFKYLVFLCFNLQHFLNNVDLKNPVSCH